MLSFLVSEMKMASFTPPVRLLACLHTPIKKDRTNCSLMVRDSDRRRSGSHRTARRGRLPAERVFFAPSLVSAQPIYCIRFFLLFARRRPLFLHSVLSAFGRDIAVASVSSRALCMAVSHQSPVSTNTIVSSSSSLAGIARGATVPEAQLSSPTSTLPATGTTSRGAERGRG